jgi:hypothetical protein
LRKRLTKEIPDFDPSKPNPQAEFNLPATPIPPRTTNVMKVPQV